MPRVKLDGTFCLTAQAEPGKKRTDYWDTATTGFVLECRASGGKTYYLRYFDAHNRQRQIKIGGHGDISFADAQKRAKRLRSEVVLGGDPAAAKAERKAVPTFAELARQHLDHAKGYLRSYDSLETVMRVHVLPKWGHYRLTEITAQDVSRWLVEKRKTMAAATSEKLRVVMNRSFELGRQWKVPGAEHNPIRDVPKLKLANARQRFLSPDEVTALLKAVDRSLNPQLGNIVRLLLLTGARRNELLHARWENIDLERKAWFIPTSKTGKSRYVPLSEAAVEVIREIPRWPNCPWMLPNPLTKKPYTCIKHPWDTARREAGVGELRIHDLRHSAASFMINAGVNLYTVGRILGHADHQSTMRYAHLADDTLMAAVEAGSAKMLSNAGGQRHGL